MRLDRLKIIEDIVREVRETLRQETVRYVVALKVDDLLQQIEATTQVMRAVEREKTS